MSSSARQLSIFIFLGAALLLGLVWLLILTELRHNRHETVAAAIRENENRAIAFKQYVTRTLEAADVAARHVGVLYAADRDLRSSVPPDRISDSVVENPLFVAVVVADRRGDVVATSIDEAPALNIAHRSTFRSLRRKPSNSIVIGKPIISPLLGRPLVALTRRIDRADGTFGGTVTVQIPAYRLIAFQEGAKSRIDDLLSVIGLDGITRARITGNRFSFGEDLRGKQVMRQQMTSPNGIYLGPSALDGIVRYFSHRRLDDYPLFVTVGISQNEILNSHWVQAKWYIGGGSLLSVLALAFACLAALALHRRERAALVLADANSRLREAQRIGRIGDWEYDAGSGVVIWSDDLCRMYKRSPADDVLGFEEWLGYLDEPSRAIFMETVNQAIAGATAAECQVTIRRHNDTSYRRIKIAAGPDFGGGVARLRGTDQDITADKVHEQIRRKAAHLSRLTAMNVTAGTIAHELNQPLAAAVNYLAASQRYARGGTPGDRALLLEGLDHVKQQILLAGNIVRRTREMLVQPEQSSAVSLPDMLGDAMQTISAVRDVSQVLFRNHFAPDAQLVVGDGVQIQQVMMNLVRNAIEASSQCGKPEVTVWTELSDDQMVKICVADNGPGIDAEAGDIFSPFSSTKNSGMGLGLALSRTIVEAHGGRIWVEKKQPPGATICFTLHAAAQSRQSGTSTRAAVNERNPG